MKKFLIFIFLLSTSLFVPENKCFNLEFHLENLFKMQEVVTYLQNNPKVKKFYEDICFGIHMNKISVYDVQLLNTACKEDPECAVIAKYLISKFTFILDKNIRQFILRKFNLEEEMISIENIKDDVVREKSESSLEEKYEKKYKKYSKMYINKLIWGGTKEFATEALEHIKKI